MSATNVVEKSAPVKASPAFDPRELRNVMGRFATGVTVITGLDGLGITANSFSSLSLDPALILWSLDLRSPNLDAFSIGVPFAVNILDLAQDELAMQFAKPSDDKYAGVQYKCNDAGVPLLDGALAQLECEVNYTKVLGDHLLIIGEVKDFHVSEGDPLLFYQGRFSSVSA